MHDFCKQRLKLHAQDVCFLNIYDISNLYRNWRNILKIMLLYTMTFFNRRIIAIENRLYLSGRQILRIMCTCNVLKSIKSWRHHQQYLFITEACSRVSTQRQWEPLNQTCDSLLSSSNVLWVQSVYNIVMFDQKKKRKRKKIGKLICRNISLLLEILWWSSKTFLIK